MRKEQLVIAALLLALLLVACAPKVSPAPAAPAKPGWQEEWDKVVAAAKAEGKLVIHTTGSAGEREAMMGGMKEAYGIAAEATITRGGLEVPKIQAERKAGIYVRDMWVGGYSASLMWKRDGWLSPVDDDLLMPDVTDPERIKKVWYQGKFPWIDSEHTHFITTLQPRYPMVINTNIIKEAEIRSYRDLLDPKWKGKLIVQDPTVVGSGQQMWAAIRDIMGDDFLRELAKTSPTVMRDQRLMLDWLAQGKVAIVVAPDTDTVIEFEKIGAPIKPLTPVEGGNLSAGASGVTRFDRPANPNAARVFINWITSKQGQEAYAVAGRYHSLRLDVSTAHLRPAWMRQPGVPYADSWSEESQLVKSEAAAKFGMEILGPLMKK